MGMALPSPARAAVRRSERRPGARRAGNRTPWASGKSAPVWRTNRRATRRTGSFHFFRYSATTLRNGRGQPIRNGVAECVPRARPRRRSIFPRRKRRRHDRIAVDRERVADRDERNTQMLGDCTTRRLHLIDKKRVDGSRAESPQARRGRPYVLPRATSRIVNRSAAGPFNRPSSASEAGSEPRGWSSCPIGSKPSPSERILSSRSTIWRYVTRWPRAMQLAPKRREWIDVSGDWRADDAEVRHRRAARAALS